MDTILKWLNKPKVRLLLRQVKLKTWKKKLITDVRCCFCYCYFLYFVLFCFLPLCWGCVNKRKCVCCTYTSVGSICVCVITWAATDYGWQYQQGKKHKSNNNNNATVVNKTVIIMFFIRVLYYFSIFFFRFLRDLLITSLIAYSSCLFVCIE